jgi:opacity protein-like surface antigen
MNKIISLVFLFSFSTIFSAPSYPHGVYGFLEIGRGYNNFQASDYNATAKGGQVNWVPAGRIGMGYNIDQYIGIEMGYQTFQNQVFKDLNGTGWNGVVSENSFDLLTVVRYPLGGGFYLLGKIGSAYVNAKQGLVNPDNGKPAPSSARHLYVWRPEYAAGMSMTLSDFPSVSFLATYSRIIGDEGKHFPTSELYSLGFIFHF